MLYIVVVSKTNKKWTTILYYMLSEDMLSSSFSSFSIETFPHDCDLATGFFARKTALIEYVISE